MVTSGIERPLPSKADAACSVMRSVWAPASDVESPKTISASRIRTAVIDTLWTESILFAATNGRRHEESGPRRHEATKQFRYKKKLRVFVAMRANMTADTGNAQRVIADLRELA